MKTHLTQKHHWKCLIQRIPSFCLSGLQYIFSSWSASCTFHTYWRNNPFNTHNPLLCAICVKDTSGQCLNQILSTLSADCVWKIKHPTFLINLTGEINTLFHSYSCCSAVFVLDLLIWQSLILVRLCLTLNMLENERLRMRLILWLCDLGFSPTT